MWNCIVQLITTNPRAETVSTRNNAAWISLYPYLKILGFAKLITMLLQILNQYVYECNSTLCVVVHRFHGRYLSCCDLWNDNFKNLRISRTHGILLTLDNYYYPFGMHLLITGYRVYLFCRSIDKNKRYIKYKYILVVNAMCSKTLNVHHSSRKEIRRVFDFCLNVNKGLVKLCTVFNGEQFSSKFSCKRVSWIQTRTYFIQINSQQQRQSLSTWKIWFDILSEILGLFSIRIWSKREESKTY